MARGTVIRFDEIRGYGFVTPDVGGEDVFIHVNDLLFDKRQLTPGALVEFAVEDSDRGLKASRVQIVQDAGGRADDVPAKTHSARSGDDEGLCDVLSAKEFTDEITEALLNDAHTLTGTQIVAVRRSVAKVAQGHGWLEG